MTKPPKAKVPPLANLLKAGAELGRAKVKLEAHKEPKIPKDLLAAMGAGAGAPAAAPGIARLKAAASGGAKPAKQKPAKKKR